MLLKGSGGRNPPEKNGGNVNGEHDKAVKNQNKWKEVK